MQHALVGLVTESHQSWLAPTKFYWLQARLLDSAWHMGRHGFARAGSSRVHLDGSTRSEAFWRTKNCQRQKWSVCRWMRGSGRLRRPITNWQMLEPINQTENTITAPSTVESKSSDLNPARAWVRPCGRLGSARQHTEKPWVRYARLEPSQTELRGWNNSACWLLLTYAGASQPRNQSGKYSNV